MSMSVSLAELKVGERAKILGFKPGKTAYRQRLLALGFIPESEFTIVRIAPLGDPIEIQLNNTLLCLRKQEGSIMEIERL